MAKGSFAVLKKGDNQVKNIIIADDDFKIEGYETYPLGDDISCQTGMYYNKKDKIFYDDAEFTLIGGEPAL